MGGGNWKNRYIVGGISVVLSLGNAQGRAPTSSVQDLWIPQAGTKEKIFLRPAEAYYFGRSVPEV